MVAPARCARDWLRVEYGIEKASNKPLAVAELGSGTWVGGAGCRRGYEERLLSPFPLSSEAEERGIKLWNA
jgi:hypothetical protein